MKFFAFLLGIVLALSCLSLKGQSSDIPLKKNLPTTGNTFYACKSGRKDKISAFSLLGSF